MVMVLSGVAGCNQTVAGELATLSGAYVGDVVTSVVTAGLQRILGLADSDSSGEQSSGDEHTHDSTALHDHDH